MTIKLKKYLPSANEISKEAENGLIKEIETIKKELKTLEKAYENYELDSLRNSVTIARVRISTINSVLAHIGYMIEEED